MLRVLKRSGRALSAVDTPPGAPRCTAAQPVSKCVVGTRFCSSTKIASLCSSRRGYAALAHAHTLAKGYAAGFGTCSAIGKLLL
jgi:hypothetical protein